MSQRDPNQAIVDADEEGFPKGTGFPDPRAYLLALLPLLAALMPSAAIARNLPTTGQAR
jgi:hypothetical protein